MHNTESVHNADIQVSIVWTRAENAKNPIVRLVYHPNLKISINVHGASWLEVRAVVTIVKNGKWTVIQKFVFVATIFAAQIVRH
jgi:hypothetical protein